MHVELSQAWQNALKVSAGRFLALYQLLDAGTPASEIAKLFRGADGCVLCINAGRIGIDPNCANCPVTGFGKDMGYRCLQPSAPPAEGEIRVKSKRTTLKEFVRALHKNNVEEAKDLAFRLYMSMSIAGSMDRVIEYEKYLTR